MSRRWIVCKFREGDARGYSYVYDGEEQFEPGDKVRVADRSGDGFKVVTVVSEHFDEPEFECKPVLGRHVEEPPQPDLLGE